MYAIRTYRGDRRVSRRQAILHAARVAGRKRDIHSQITAAPRGEKGQLVELAGRVFDASRRYALPPRSLAQRLASRLVAIGEREIQSRRLSTPAGWDEFSPELLARRPGLWLILGAGWYEYSHRYGSRYQSAAYLCGKDEGQYWAVRVPSTCASVAEAMAFLTPAPIREAEERGLPVKRQGDIYFRPVARLSDHDMSALQGTRHEARQRKSGSLTVVHPEHRPIILSGKYTWRAYQQRQVDGHGRRAAD